MGASPSCARCCDNAVDGSKLVIREGRRTATLPAAGDDSMKLQPHGTIQIRPTTATPPSTQVRKIGQNTSTPMKKQTLPPPEMARPLRMPEGKKQKMPVHNTDSPLIREELVIPPPPPQAAAADRSSLPARRISDDEFHDPFSADATPMPAKKRTSSIRENYHKPPSDGIGVGASSSLLATFGVNSISPHQATDSSSSSSSARYPPGRPTQATAASKNAVRPEEDQPMQLSESPVTVASHTFPAISEVTPSRNVRERIQISHVDPSALGGGCYLQYTTVGGGVLRILWSKTYPEGAVNIAFLKPAKEPPAFKFKGETRKQDLVKGVQRDKNLLYQGWVSFAKLCKQNEAQLTLLDGINDVPPVSIFFVDKKNRVHQVTHEDWFSLDDAEAVAAMSAGADVLTGIATLPSGMFCQLASKVGAALNV